MNRFFRIIPICAAALLFTAAAPGLAAADHGRPGGHGKGHYQVYKGHGHKVHRRHGGHRHGYRHWRRHDHGHFRPRYHRHRHGYRRHRYGYRRHHYGYRPYYGYAPYWWRYGYIHGG